MSESVVYTHTVSINKQQLENALTAIKRDLDIDEDPSILDTENVLKNQPLLDYICSQMIEDSTGQYDPDEFWNQDGWCDWRDHI